MRSLKEPKSPCGGWRRGVRSFLFGRDKHFNLATVAIFTEALPSTSSPSPPLAPLGQQDPAVQEAISLQLS